MRENDTHFDSIYPILFENTTAKFENDFGFQIQNITLSIPQTQFKYFIRNSFPPQIIYKIYQKDSKSKGKH